MIAKACHWQISLEELYYLKLQLCST